MAESPLPSPGSGRDDDEARTPGALQPVAARRIAAQGWMGVIGLLAAALVAGPWPGLSSWSLLWRAPVGVLGLVLARPRRRFPWLLSAALVVAALVVDLTSPGVRDAHDLAAQVGRRVVAVQVVLGELAGGQPMRELLSPGGGVAEPEAAFVLAEGALKRLPARVDSLVIVDERGLPVAWSGSSPRLPIGLRALGERAVVSERGVGSVWLWWRESVSDAGRLLGGVILGVELSEDGQRHVLGVSAGRAAMMAPVQESGAAVPVSDSSSLVNLEVRPTSPVPWSVPGLVLVAVLGGLAAGRGRVAPVLAGAAAASLPLLLGWVGGGWWLVGGLAALAMGLVHIPRSSLQRAFGAAFVGVVGWLMPSLIELLDLDVVPPSFLWPGVLRWATIVALAALVRAASFGHRPFPWLVRLTACAPLAVGYWIADPRLMAAGAALAAFFSLAGRGLLPPTVVAAMLLAGSNDATQRASLVATTQETLPRLELLEGTAREALAALPQGTMAEIPRLEARQQLTVLGRLVMEKGVARRLPGASFFLVDPQGELAATWGDTPLTTEGRPRQLARRDLGAGWALVVASPPFPLDMLAGLAGAGIAGPIAVFDRSGAPLSRGATFRPLSPARVGAALVAKASWADLRVGERELRTYLRAHGDLVVAVPWVRPSLAGMGLVLAALTLWGLFPWSLWEGRRRWTRWWVRRNTFMGRVRVLLAVTTVLPVLLLAQLLPRQWEKQRERAQLELGRAVSRSLAAAGWQEGLIWLVREMGGTVAFYRDGMLTSSTRPDLAILGVIPWLSPAEAYVRSVRAWREPVVTGVTETNVFAPVRRGDEQLVVAALGLQVAGLERAPTPGEWFFVTAILALAAALTTAERLGQGLARPLRRLVGAARRVERGDSVGQLELGRDEDLGALSRAFVTMASGVKRREEELRRERDLLHRVLRTLSAGVLVADAAGRVEMANPAARTLLAGEETVDGLARRLGESIATLARDASAGEGGTETLHPTTAPEALWRVSAVPLAGAAGRILLVMEDLSELARAERLATLAELARIAAHEVKNPLTPIRLWAEELQAALGRGADAVVPVAKIAAEQILGSVEHLKEVAQGFSNLVALEHWEAEVFDVLEVARDVVAEYRVLAQRGVVVEAYGQAALIRADRQWVRRALRHLLENSARVLAGKSGRVDVRVGADGSWVTVAVGDTGGGVPDALLARLFEPHFSTTSEGSGLGLAVVRRVAVGAGGSAEASNREGGLEVRLRFPAVNPGWPGPEGREEDMHG